VKVCSLYGDGFYYIPGTQTCMKIGGFLRTEWDANAGASFTTFTIGTNAQFTRAGDQLTTRARGVITLDVREQTTWGTLRAYLAGGWNCTSNDAPTISLPGTQVPVTGGGGVTGSAPNGASNTYLLRAFIQLGGFTFGKTASFYDFFNTSKYTYQTNFIYQDYAGVGVNLYGYTQQFGNGIAATVSVQDPTPFEHPIVDLTAGGVAGSFGGFVGAAGSPFVLGGAPTNDAWQNGGFNVPDIVFNVRLDQAWGGAQAAAILHDNRARYYNNTLAATGTVAGASHPSDKWGWAVSGGLELNLPWAKGDSFAVQSRYCVGDRERCCDNSGTRLQDLAWSLVNTTNKIGLGWQNHAFFANTAASALSTASSRATASRGAPRCSRSRACYEKPGSKSKTGPMAASP